ncbi:MAG: heme-binding protein [Erysipelotrichaceae bacterium]|jgi:uncharacterized protein (UPF0303 family)|nr:heme-binding protein [Erysipelotrichaceae bacterium]MCI1326892.1 heme-binding protein [Solobacterium sp.]MCH4045678.1 heme-binding protein [Erysipelotrichaceae bacterium]MCH4122887.1 heme-binding protein [Erysipelotrichaceae bacterium]MCI1363416.1 heme-binding protein [Solobacterium sp.]
MYSEENLKILEEQENLLRYDHFSSSDALVLGNAIAQAALSFDRGIVIQIKRLSDDMVIFQYAMDDKAPRNFFFTKIKEDSVRRCHHSSAWQYVYECMHNEKQDTSGGGFPICLKDGSETAILLVSGLHEGKDHEVLLIGLEKVLQVKVPRLNKEIA